MPPKAPSNLSAKMRAGFFDTVSEGLPRIVELDIEKIQVNPDQPRKFFDENTIRDLASDIERRGLLQPITVKSTGDDSYLLAAGERRLRAHRFLQRATIAAIITTGDTDEIALVENIQREDLRPMELAEALDRLKQKHQYTDEELSKVIGKSRSRITNILAITKLPESIRAEARISDAVSVGFLMELARMTEEAQSVAWEAFKTGTNTVREIRGKREGSAASIGSETPVAKAIKSLHIAAAMVTKLVGQCTKEDRAQLIEAKSRLDKALSEVSEHD